MFCIKQQVLKQPEQDIIENRDYFLKLTDITNPCMSGFAFKRVSRLLIIQERGHFSEKSQLFSYYDKNLDIQNDIIDMIIYPK